MISNAQSHKWGRARIFLRDSVRDTHSLIIMFVTNYKALSRKSDCAQIVKLYNVDVLKFVSGIEI